jgi:hypothetical protein
LAWPGVYRHEHGRNHGPRKHGAKPQKCSLPGRSQAGVGVRFSRNQNALLHCTQAPNCWWKSGPKGGRRHNSLLSLLPPLACHQETSTSACARSGNAKT